VLHEPEAYPYARAADARARGGDALAPTVLMATVTGRGSGVGGDASGAACAALTADAVQLACGFGDAAVRVYRLDHGAGDDAGAAEAAAAAEGGGGASKKQRTSAQPAGPRPASLVGHTAAVYGAAWMPGNRHLLTCAGDGDVRLWDAASSSCAARYDCHQSPVWGVAVARYGHYFATAGHDRTARLWATDANAPLRVFAGHDGDVSAVAFHPNCNYVLTGSSDRTARMWDVRCGSCVRVFDGGSSGLSALAFAPGGGVCTAAGEERGELTTWDVGTAKCVSASAAAGGHTGTVCSAAYSPDGHALATASLDGTVRVWDAAALRGDASEDPDVEPHVSFYTKSTPVLDVAWTAGNMLQAAGKFCPGGA